MKKYNVRPEYQEKWFWNQYPEALDENEVRRLAAEWGLTEEDLEEQLEDYEAKKEEKKEMKKYTRIEWEKTLNPWPDAITVDGKKLMVGAWNDKGVWYNETGEKQARGVYVKKAAFQNAFRRGETFAEVNEYGTPRGFKKGRPGID